MCDEVTSVDRVEMNIRVHLPASKDRVAARMRLPLLYPFTQLVTSRGRRDGAVANVISASYEEVTFCWQGTAKKRVLV